LEKEIKVILNDGDEKSKHCPTWLPITVCARRERRKKKPAKRAIKQVFKQIVELVPHWPMVQRDQQLCLLYIVNRAEKSIKSKTPVISCVSLLVEPTINIW
jgi:hypothetical protein